MSKVLTVDDSASISMYFLFFLQFFCNFSALVFDVRDTTNLDSVIKDWMPARVRMRGSDYALGTEGIDQKEWRHS